MALEFDKKPLEWGNAGTEIPEDIRANGWQAGYKPPADYFNYKWAHDAALHKELQEKIVEVANAVEEAGGHQQVTTGSANDLPDGTCAVSASVTGLPEAGVACVITTTTISSAQKVQNATTTTGGVYVRVYNGGVWSNWTVASGGGSSEVEYLKNITPDTTGYASLLEYMVARYDEHPVIYGSVSGFSDMPSGVTTAQGCINLCGGILSITLSTRDAMYCRGTNSLTQWTGAWRTVYDTNNKPTAADVGADPSGSASTALSNAKSYTDQKIAAIPTPDVSGQIGTHNSSTTAHNDIRTAVSTAQSTANTAKTNAATAQSTADTAKTNAATAQSTADNHIANKSNPHGVTTGQIGAVPTSRTVNGKALSGNITLSASDVGAAAASHGNHVPTTETANAARFLRNDNTWQNVTPANIGAATTAAVSTAQSTADTAKANAATAQTTANEAKTAAATAQSTANTAQSTANAAQTAANSKAPMYTYGTNDLQAGVSALATGVLHFVYD